MCVFVVVVSWQSQKSVPSSIYVQCTNHLISLIKMLSKFHWHKYRVWVKCMFRLCLILNCHFSQTARRKECCLLISRCVRNKLFWCDMLRRREVYIYIYSIFMRTCRIDCDEEEKVWWKFNFIIISTFTKDKSLSASFHSSNGCLLLSFVNAAQIAPSLTLFIYLRCVFDEMIALNISHCVCVWYWYSLLYTARWPSDSLAADVGLSSIVLDSNFRTGDDIKKLTSFSCSSQHRIELWAFCCCCCYCCGYQQKYVPWNVDVLSVFASNIFIGLHCLVSVLEIESSHSILGSHRIDCATDGSRTKEFANDHRFVLSLSQRCHCYCSCCCPRAHNHHPHNDTATENQKRHCEWHERQHPFPHLSVTHKILCGWKISFTCRGFFGPFSSSRHCRRSRREVFRTNIQLWLCMCFSNRLLLHMKTEAFCKKKDHQSMKP